MTNKPPSDSKSSQETALGFDEFIAILVAFATVGGILFWSFSRKESGWNLNGVLSPVPTPSGNVQQNPAPLTPTPSGNIQQNPAPLTPSGTLEPNTNSNLNTLPLSPDTPNTPNINIVEPSTTPFPNYQEIPIPVIPQTSRVAPMELPQRQIPLSSSTGFESSIKSSPLPLVTPAEKQSTIPPPIAFEDVPATFWAGGFIQALSSRRIIRGFPDYSFRPNQPVTRAEFAAILQQAFDKDKEVAQSNISLQDIGAKYWAKPAISQAISTGFLKGYPDKTFKPEQKISRSQVLVSLASGLNLKPLANQTQVLSVYQDAQDIPKYATAKIAAATASKLVVNYPNIKVLAPNREVTRAEVAAMIHQALVQTGTLEEIPSSSIVRSPTP